MLKVWSTFIFTLTQQTYKIPKATKYLKSDHKDAYLKWIDSGSIIWNLRNTSFTDKFPCVTSDIFLSEDTK